MIKRFFAKASGFDKIAEHFAATHEPGLPGLTKQTIQIGAVRFRNCVDIYFDAQGFYFRAHILFSSYPMIFVPWDEISNVKQAKIYGREAFQFSIGTPSAGTIRIPARIFNEIKSYLKI